MKRRILLTAALPYANGDIHLGHLVEYIQADIWSRFQKLRGHECWFVCADDAHGTPIMLRAEAEGITPETLIKTMQTAHERDFAGFNIAFDNYYSTHSEENRLLSEQIFAALQNQNAIAEREIKQLYDAKKGIFLPDRYVRGTCPLCSAEDQYGDSCEVCGGVYSPTELKSPRSALSDAVPEIRPSLHYFLQLSGEENTLAEWLSADIDNPAVPADSDRPGGDKLPRLQREAVNKLNEWLRDGLRDWDVSRDPPYFGFRIPGAPSEKYFYVWLDAPIGYMASFRAFCRRGGQGESGGAAGGKLFDDFWLAENEQRTELYHFIGKDILYFHGLFWPTMLAKSGHRRPTRLFVHGFLTVNGEKMSKSRGTFITAAQYLAGQLPPDVLRYYYACKLGDRIEDIDLNLDDFMTRVNGDLVGKLFNVPSRTAGFLHKFFAGRLDDRSEVGLSAEGAAAVADAYERRRYQDVVRLLLQETDALNAYVDNAKPWLLAQDTAQHGTLHAVCSEALRRFHQLIGYLSPIMPALAAAAAEFLTVEQYHWTATGIAPLPAGHTVNRYHHLLKRIEKKEVDALLNKPEEADKPAAADNAKDSETIKLDEFLQVDIRVASIITAEAVEGSDKLLRLAVDLGDGDQRQVFAGLQAYYQPADLVGQQVIMLANLAPRKMRFGVSQGMVLAATTDDGGLVLVQPSGKIKAGAKIR